MIKSQQYSRSLLRAVAFPTVAAILILGVLIGSILHFSTSRSDAFAIAQQEKLIKLAVGQSLSAIARDQEASTYWDDAVLRTRQRPLDYAWLDNNLGTWFHTYYKHDEAYLLDPEDRPVYAMQNGFRSQPATFRKVAARALPLAKDLRHALRTTFLAPEGSQGKTIGASQVTTIGGRPAFISVKPIVSESGTISQVPGAEYLHVSVRYLDRSFLRDLAGQYGIENARFGTTPALGSIALTDNEEHRIGYINWQPFVPGRAIEERLVPVLLLALFAVATSIALLLAGLRRGRMELEASRAQAEHLAFHDSLTGLPNRKLFEDRLDHALCRRGSRVAVLLLDLDRFKNVNDTLGHQAGDALIRDFGMRLTKLTREGDTISRLGGDEFAILIEDTDQSDVKRLAKRIVEDIRRPFEIIGTHVYVGVSVGVALSGAQASDRLELVRRADIALYAAKDGGRDSYRIFSSDMDTGVKLRSAIEDELRISLGSGQGLEVHYQPQVGPSGEIIGLEALVRWFHPSRGCVAPEHFVPVAEDTGLIVPLGEWILREACLAAKRWPNLFVSVNLSPVQFRSAGFFDSLMRIVRSSGAKPSSIQLEVTERVLLEDDDKVRAVLRKLRAAGFTIVLDDFGTGYSSLSYLRKFQVDKLKIDKSFVSHLGEAADSRAIIAAILALGQAMGIAVAAEGVETPDQRRFLELAGCKEMQGYLFAKALPADEIAGLLPRGRAAAA
jgi:diguanylate cyclase (GGDEF)-like protein